MLARGLTTLLRGAEPGELDVIVVANACTDARPPWRAGRASA